METQTTNKFQVGDVIYRPEFGYRTITAVRGGEYIHTWTTTEVERQAEMIAEGHTSDQSIGYVDAHYALVESPEPKTEEVKNMSKFQAGDIIQYRTYTNERRIVMVVDDDHYTLSDHLTAFDPTGNDAYTETQEYVDSVYTLVAANPAAGQTDAHKADMAKLSELLAAEAKTRGWCSEYASVIDRFNEQLTIPLVAHPKISVTTTAEFIITLRRTDEVDNASGNPADHAYNLYWDEAVKAVTPPPGWELVTVTRNGHQYTTS